MLDLDATGDVLAIAAIAADCGRSPVSPPGSIIARGKERQTGLIELPGGTGNRLVDLGSAAAIPIGVLAGVVAAFVFAPGEEQTVDNEVVRQVQLGDLLLISAVAGLSGTAFLAAIQERFMATLKTERAETKLQSTVAGLMKIKETAKDKNRAKKATETKHETVRRKLERTRKQTPPEISTALSKADMRTLTVEGEVVELDAPMTNEQLSDEATDIIDSVTDEATDAMSEQVTSDVDLLLQTLDPKGAFSDSS